MNTSTPTLIALKENAGNLPTSLDPLQQLLAPHVNVLIMFWFIVWVLTGVVVLYRLWAEYRESR